MVSNRILKPISNQPLYRVVDNGVKKVQQKLLSTLPDAVYTSAKAVNFIECIGRKFSSAEQRLVLGATALLTQPFIDARNRHVDEKTRKVSVARTIAKIIAGTVTGFAVRKCAIKSMSKFSKFFEPSGIEKFTADELINYRNAMGTIVALVAMTVTNFVIDAPLTRYLTNVFLGKHKTGGQDETSS